MQKVSFWKTLLSRISLSRITAYVLRHKLVILCTIAAYYLAQGAGIFNKFSFHDDSQLLFEVGSTIASGRWMLFVIGVYSSRFFGDGYFSLPVFNGMLALLCLLGVVLLLIHLFQIKNQSLCAMIGILLACFPGMTSLFGYAFTMHFYMFSLLLGVLGAYCICRFQKWYSYGFGCLMIACSIGIYQAFIPFILSLLLLYWCMLLRRSTLPIIKLIMKAACMACSVLLAFLVYFGVSKLFQIRFQVELTSYAGIGNMGSIPVSDYLQRIGMAYRDFFLPQSYPSANAFPYNSIILYYLSVFLLTVAVLVNAIALSRRDLKKGLLYIVSFSLFPMISNLILVIAAVDNLHSIMIFGKTVPLLALVFLVDTLHLNRAVWEKTLQRSVCVIFIVLSLMYCRYDNKCYLMAEFSQSQAISYFNTLITRIKSTDGYRDNLPVCFVGETISDESVPDFGQTFRLYTNPYGDLNLYLNDYARTSFIRNWCGYSPEYVYAADLHDQSAVAEMACYPDDGSIQILDGVVVVKFS